MDTTIRNGVWTPWVEALICFVDCVSGFKGSINETLPRRNADTFPKGAQTCGERFELKRSGKYK